MKTELLPSSFRDPDGFLFTFDRVLYRQINNSYRENYNHLISSGLYKNLVESDLLIPHTECDNKYAFNSLASRVIRPEPIDFISYPYEWSFSQLKDAALTTLKIQKIALEYGMSLKDSSAYNIQFKNCKPLLIDTLSFEKIPDGKPWKAYRQFCQHFLAPLALMSYCDIRFNQLLKSFIDGIPLEMASKQLPHKTFFKLGLFFHIHLHAKSQKHYSDKKIELNTRGVSKRSLVGMLDNLQSCTRALKWKPAGTEWSDYYEKTNYSDNSFEGKKTLISEYLDISGVKSLWDIGANRGVFSRIASKKGIKTVSFDIDPAAVEKNYLTCKKGETTNILPLLSDITNPSPAIGWRNNERQSLLERGPVDGILALALIHHLAISNNLPLSKIASLFVELCTTLIIEFIPKSDSQVQKLLSTRVDCFPDYTRSHFEKVFLEYFTMEASSPVFDSERTIYMFKKRNGKCL